MPHVTHRRSVFSTPWFDIVARTLDSSPSTEPHYSLAMPDYVTIVPVTERDEVVLVRQYRPAVERNTLELPSGHVERDELPEEAATRELFEETGFRAVSLEPLGCLAPDTGRLSNTLWCYVARVERVDGAHGELEVVVSDAQRLLEQIARAEFDHALHVAVVLLALIKSSNVRRLLPSLAEGLANSWPRASTIGKSE